MRQAKGKYRPKGSKKAYDYMADIAEEHDRIGDLPLLDGKGFTVAIARNGKLVYYYNAAFGGNLIDLDPRMDPEMPWEIVKRCSREEEA